MTFKREKENLGFQQGANPYTTLSVGTKALTKQWVEDLKIPEGNYRINNDGSLDLMFEDLIKIHEVPPKEVKLNIGPHIFNKRFKHIDHSLLEIVDITKLSKPRELLFQINELWHLLKHQNTISIINQIKLINLEFGEDYGNKKGNIFTKSNRYFRQVFTNGNIDWNKIEPYLYDIGILVKKPIGPITEASNIEFQQGHEPYHTLSIGKKYNPFKEGDLIILTNHVFWFDDNNYGGSWHDTNNVITDPLTNSLIFAKGTILTYVSEDAEFQNDKHEYIPHKWIKENKHVWERIVNEEFKQNQDAYKTLDIGSNRPSSWPRSYEDLDDQQKEWAIESVRDMQSGEIIIDDDFLLEPPYKDIIALFGEDFYEEIMNDKPIIRNESSKLYYNIHYPNRYINLSEAAKINNEYYFYLWLGIPEQMHDKIYYDIGEDTIEFEENEYNYEFTPKENNILNDAKLKFKRHCIQVLDSIAEGFDYLTSDEAIKEDIINNNQKFDEDGAIVKESLNEFERGRNPYNAMGIGNRVKIEKWFEENAPDFYYNINDNIELNLQWYDIITGSTIQDLPSFAKINYAEHKLEYNFNKLSFDDIKKHTDVNNMKQGSHDKMIIELFYLRDIYQNGDKLELEDKLIDLLEEFGEKILEKNNLNSVFGKTGQNIILLGKKLARTEMQKDTDELFNTYIFIKYDEYKEVTIDGEDFHKKILGIENLLKIDMYNMADLMNINGMKMRAVTVENGKVYAVKIPKYMADKDNYYNDDIDDKLRSYIKEKMYNI